MRVMAWFLRTLAGLSALALSVLVVGGGLALLAPWIERWAPGAWSSLGLLLVAGLGLQRGLAFGVGRAGAWARRRLLSEVELLRDAGPAEVSRACVQDPRGALRGYAVLGLWERGSQRLSFLVRPSRSLGCYLFRTVPADRRGDPGALALIEQERRALEALGDVSGAPALREARPLPDGRPTLVVSGPCGEPLSELAGRLSFERCLIIASRVAGFVIQVHRRGWALRVLSPGSIGLREDGALSFRALAYACREDEPGAALPLELRRWASPELLGQGRPAHRGDDSYALGALLCALISGLDDPSILRGDEHRGLIRRSLEECGAGPELGDRTATLIASALGGSGPDMRGWLRELAALLDHLEGRAQD